MILSLYKIINWYLDNERTNKLSNEINDIVKITKVSGGEIVGKPAKKDDPFSDLINMNLSNVDFTKLKEMNSDSVAFIEVNGTKVSYPVVKTTDNDFYLYHSFDKSYNQSGWIFMDYRNKLDGKDKNIIIYGHDTKDESMFGSLKYTLKSSWFDKNKYVYLTLNDVKYTYEVFSVYETPKEEYYIKTDFNNDFKDFVNTLSKRSVHNFNVSVGENDSILTLSTCSHYGKDRIVLHAKKI